MAVCLWIQLSKCLKIKQSKNSPTWKHIKEQKINKTTKNMSGGEPGRFMHSEDPTVHGYSRCWFCSIFSLSSFTQCWGQTGLAGRFLQCPLPWKHRCWWSIYSDASLWLSEVAPFRSDIRHWSKVLPLPSWKPFSPQTVYITQYG